MDNSAASGMPEGRCTWKGRRRAGGGQEEGRRRAGGGQEEGRGAHHTYARIQTATADAGERRVVGSNHVKSHIVKDASLIHP